MSIIKLEGHAIRVNDDGLVSLTDMAKAHVGGDNQAATDAIRNWFKIANTLDFVEEIERQTNEGFNTAYLGRIRKEMRNGYSRISLAKFIELTGATSLRVQRGRYGGTWVHRFLAINFANWCSPAFQYAFMMAYENLTKSISGQSALEWTVGKLTDHVEDMRNLLDVIPGQKPARNRLGTDNPKE